MNASAIKCSRARASVPRRQTSVRKHVVTALDTGKEGASASGYAVAGLRPTSPKAWSMIAKELKKNGLKFAPANDATKRGTIVIDIRPVQDYDASHIPGAVNAEFFKSIQGWDPVKILRRAVFAFFGILNGTEYNPEYVAVETAQPGSLAL